MVSVITTTKDDVHLIEPSIRSILFQDFDEPYEIIAVDDGSTDGTIDEIRRKFGKQIQIIKKEQEAGWLSSLQMATEAAVSDVLVISGPHCVFRPDWLHTIVECCRSEPEISIITGPAFHGHRFMEKLSALTLHAQFISPKRGSADHIFDANFAIKKEVLVHLLSHLPVEKSLNDGIGCALLSSEAKRQGIPIAYEPQMAAFHISPGFRGYLSEWKGITAENTIDIRFLDSSIRGAGMMRYLSLVPLIYPWVRIIIDAKNAWYFRTNLGLRYTELPILLTGAALGKIWYCTGLIRAIKDRKKRESRQLTNSSRCAEGQ